MTLLPLRLTVFTGVRAVMLPCWLKNACPPVVPVTTLMFCGGVLLSVPPVPTETVTKKLFGALPVVAMMLPLPSIIDPLARESLSCSVMLPLVAVSDAAAAVCNTPAAFCTFIAPPLAAMLLRVSGPLSVMVKLNALDFASVFADALVLLRATNPFVFAAKVAVSI